MKKPSKIDSQTKIPNHDMYLSLRLSDGTVVDKLRPEDLFLHRPELLKPWRVPAAYKDQKHLPGYFWMSQTGRLVNYESRLEMTNLKRMDFEEDISFVLAQPFVLHFWVGASKRRHIPDFLLWRKNAPLLLVNVKPKAFMESPRNRDSFAACNSLSQFVRLEHRVYGEPEPIFFANLRWLAGFRREPLAMPDVAAQLIERLQYQALSFAQWISGIGEEGLTRPVAFHLLWKRKAVFNSSRVLCDDTSIWLGA